MGQDCGRVGVVNGERTRAARLPASKCKATPRSTDGNCHPLFSPCHSAVAGRTTMGQRPFKPSFLGLADTAPANAAGRTPLGFFPTAAWVCQQFHVVCPASTAARCSIACLRCDSGQLSLQRRPPAHTTATGCCPEMLSRAPGALDSACSHECPSRNDAVAAAA